MGEGGQNLIYQVPWSCEAKPTVLVSQRTVCKDKEAAVMTAGLNTENVV